MFPGSRGETAGWVLSSGKGPWHLNLSRGERACVTCSLPGKLGTGCRPGRRRVPPPPWPRSLDRPPEPVSWTSPSAFPHVFSAALFLCEEHRLAADPRKLFCLNSAVPRELPTGPSCSGSCARKPGSLGADGWGGLCPPRLPHPQDFCLVPSGPQIGKDGL